MFYFDKANPLVTFMDIRKESFDFSGNRHMEIAPDVVADFKSIPFGDSSYDMVVFDPPHLLHIGNNAYMAKKYGKLKSNTWKADIKQGFAECFRVLKQDGVLIFKWSSVQIPLREIVNLAPIKPLLGNKNSKGKTFWLVFVKAGENIES